MKKNLTRLRQEKGLTFTDLEKFVGIDRTSLSRIEKGERGLNEYHLMVLADFFKVSTDFLLDRTKEAPTIRYIDIPIKRVAPLADTEEYQVVMSLIDRLTRDELIMLKGMILAIIGNSNNSKDNKSNIS